MQKPPCWCPWILTAKSDLDSFLSARKQILQPLSLKAHLRERFDEEEVRRGYALSGETYAIGSLFSRYPDRQRSDDTIRITHSCAY